MRRGAHIRASNEPVIRQTAGLMLSFVSLQSLGAHVVSPGGCIAFNPGFTSLPVVRKPVLRKLILLMAGAMLVLMGEKD